ncbi:MAG: 30S ribosomal protein S11 [Patescibacteria group bacterium]|nr:30S ribosomal protein S11 [Patescibacteria group bacterium]MCL5224402.1 30S ribosomal protein S11 [Patescibacteria group bacterium]
MAEKEKKTIEKKDATAKAEAAAAAGAKEVKKSSKHIENGRIYISASFNNTAVSVTDERGNVVAWATSGGLGFAGPKKATPFAASKVVAAIVEKINKTGPFNVDVYISGVGSGRDSALRSLATYPFNILSIKDVTPIPHNGVKPPKTRRV